MLFRILQIAVPFIWFGLVIGLAFIETPLKFQAQGITLPLGLGIGRLVFFVLNKIEIVLALLLIFSVIRLCPRGKLAVWSIAVIATLLLLETVWLLPLLDARTKEVIAGTAAPYSYTHIIYIVFDAVKVILLFALGVSMTKQHLRTEL